MELRLCRCGDFDKVFLSTYICSFITNPAATILFSGFSQAGGFYVLAISFRHFSMILYKKKSTRTENFFQWALFLAPKLSLKLSLDCITFFSLSRLCRVDTQKEKKSSAVKIWMKTNLASRNFDFRHQIIEFRFQFKETFHFSRWFRFNLIDIMAMIFNSLSVWNSYGAFPTLLYFTQNK